MVGRILHNPYGLSHRFREGSTASLAWRTPRISLAVRITDIAGVLAHGARRWPVNWAALLAGCVFSCVGRRCGGRDDFSVEELAAIGWRRFYSVHAEIVRGGSYGGEATKSRTRLIQLNNSSLRVCGPRGAVNTVGALNPSHTS